MQFSKMAVPPFTQLELISHGLKIMKVNIIFAGQHNQQIEHHLTTMVGFGDYIKEHISTSQHL
jgi:hypothetical protein